MEVQLEIDTDLIHVYVESFVDCSHMAVADYLQGFMALNGHFEIDCASKLVLWLCLVLGFCFVIHKATVSHYCSMLVALTHT